MRLFLSAENMIVTIENCKESLKKRLPELISKLSKVTTYKGNDKKSIVFLYTR